ncbi:HopJ type III effector protein [Lacinutrix sp. C3R15]|uniref:HopJ type III effector protein n=1 Tax=Flavobacteriaceae TaxID=49546 RepID=UPI001C094093|nr:MULTISPECIES: HopJ type III effector protein [Flavobacteriaceae]MBU2937960.1 HopJ type III effector protein [Lacinutrix sp. C3R15]MDO6621274.1 HopJ type III effector protein [Oceanihabitans sp. 1_MG-2023]
MNITTFKTKLKTTPKNIAFSETMEVIEANYEFTPKAFKNGVLENGEGQNSGSCKLFAFAQAEGLSKEEALACFGSFYFDEVLNDPNGEGHQNIRNFIKTGFEGLVFEGSPLTKK